LAIELYPWIKPIEKVSSNLTREYRRFETDKKSTTISDSNAYDWIYLKWQDSEVSNEELMELLHYCTSTET
jgi:hypothetical protein